MNPKNELIDAFMKEHNCTRATAYRKLRLATVSPTVSEKPSTVSKTVPTVSKSQPSHATVSQPETYELGPASSKSELPRRASGGPSRPNPLAERYDRAVEAKFGKLLPPTETFTLQDGTVIPIYRREYPNGNRASK